MGRTLVQWASHPTWSAPRHAACIGISQQWRANLTDGNSVNPAQVTSIKKNFINLTVLAGDRNSILVAGALLRQPIRLSYRERRDFWAFQNELALLGAGGRYAAVDASAPWLELKTKLWFRDRGRAFFGQKGF